MRRHKLWYLEKNGRKSIVEKKEFWLYSPSIMKFLTITKKKQSNVEPIGYEKKTILFLIQNLFINHKF